MNPKFKLLGAMLGSFVVSFVVGFLQIPLSIDGAAALTVGVMILTYMYLGDTYGG